MKFKNKSNLTLLMGLGVILIFSLLINNNLNFAIKSNDNFGLENQILKTSEISGKIHLNSSSDWVDFKNAGNCTGSGTSSDPYLIEDLVIDAGGVGSCIFIENSDVHFVVSNCTLTNSVGSMIGDPEGGIKFMNSSNGKFIDNTVKNNNFAFYSEKSNNTVIIGNTFDNNYGIYILFCNDIIAYLNNFQNNMLNLFELDCTYRFYSEQKFVYNYGGKTYESYMGNYWNNYRQNHRGTDNNSDGIGDIPIIYKDSFISKVEPFPLYYPIENYEIIGKVSEDAILGFNIFFLLGILSIVSIFIIKKVRK